MTKKSVFIIDSFEDIDSVGIYYQDKNTWFEIQKDEDGYCVFGMVCGDSPTCISAGNWNTVKYWKTLSGLKRYLSRCVYSGKWGMFRWDVKYTVKEIVR